ncbi:MAG: hypothetical protein ACFFAQ_10960 [Promethearchaeota archaeon]
MSEDFKYCENCGENVEGEIFACYECGNSICEMCANICKNCGEYLCDGCYHDHKKKCN